MNHHMKLLNHLANRLAAFVLALAAFTLPASAGDLPEGFVRLSDLAPAIRQDMRYAGSENFLGRPANGYEAGTCILTSPAAKALAKAQADLEKDGLSLVVFDCYRPSRAVADFVAWVRQGGVIDKRWSPKTTRADLIKQGYVGSRSAHARGSTVDVAIVSARPDASTTTPDCGANAYAMLDFGSGFDCFDPVSRVASTSISPAAGQNRAKLIGLMSKAGFRSYAGEWWHFTLRDEPFPKKSFDFSVR